MSKIIEEGENIGKHYEKQDKFINLLLLHPNQSKYRSAMLAGYAVKSLEKRVPALMKDKKFLARLDERRKEVEEAVNVNVDKVAQEYARIAFLDPANYYKFTQDGGIEVSKSYSIDMRPIAEIEEARSGKGANGKNLVKLKFYNKMDALKSLRDMLGYDKPTKHAVAGVIGTEQGLSQKGIESAIIGLLGGITQTPIAETVDSTPE
jgi:phage terminase small subunit